MAGIASRLASRARAARPTIMAPSSIRTPEDRMAWLSLPKQLDGLLDAPGCADHDQVVARSHHGLRPGGRDRLVAPQDGDDRDARTGPNRGVADRAVREWAVLADGQPIDGQALDLLLELGQLLSNARGPQGLSKRACVVLTESKRPLESIRIGGVGQVDLAATR